MLVTITLWVKVAWAWCVKHWQWLLAGLGATLAFIFLGRRTTTVIAPELVKADEAKKRIEEEAQKQLDAAAVNRDAATAAVLAAHQKAAVVLTQEQRKQVAELKSDPEKLNSFLKDVGKSARKP